MKTYFLNCSKCKQKTFHRILRISRTKGIKLICMKCSHETNYFNFNRLREYEK